MNTAYFRSREMKFTFLTGNDNIRRQRAALTRDILVLQQHFTTFKAEQWSYFPQTRVYHADIFEKAMQNLARVCILAFSPVYAHCARRIISDKPKCLFHFLSCRFRHLAFYLGARLNKMQVFVQQTSASQYGIDMGVRRTIDCAARATKSRRGSTFWVWPNSSG